MAVAALGRRREPPMHEATSAPRFRRRVQALAICTLPILIPVGLVKPPEGVLYRLELRVARGASNAGETFGDAYARAD